LEQLTFFELEQDDGQFKQLQDRLLLMEHLRLSNGNTFSLSTAHSSALNELKFLSLIGYTVADLSGLTKLTSLSLVLVAALRGKEEIFPKLTTFHGDAHFLEDGVHSCPQVNELVLKRFAESSTADRLNQYLQLPVVHINMSANLLKRFGDIGIGERVKTLKLSHVDFRSFTGVPTGRYFDEIVFDALRSLKDVSVFGKAQKVSLTNCSSIKDISCLRDVPYLVIKYCGQIKDYSCLGSQHYLVIEGSHNLLDEHLRGFGKIRRLKIYDCFRITHNSFVEIRYCKSLNKAVFTGLDYVKVELSKCETLASVSVPGRIFSFLVISCSTSFDQRSIENYTHLEFTK
jgi:hypothetical protein